MTPKVLLVDDVPMFLELQRAYLGQSSVHILTAKDGAEALEIARKERPELIFMDLYMPNMTGAECCARIKDDPQLRAVPVVMITSEKRGTDKALCDKAGCDDFMTKPIDRVVYLEMARKYVPSIDRRDCRFSCRARVRFRVYGLTLSGEILDVSANGVYVATDYGVEAESVLELAFALKEEAGALVQAKGRIAWVNSKGMPKKQSYPPGFGVELSAITNESRRILDSFLAACTS